MKVKDLIELLKTMPQEWEVGFEYNYGDYWRTHVVADVDYVEEGKVKWSDYHNMNEIAKEEYEWKDEEKAPKDKIKKMVILS